MAAKWFLIGVSLLWLLGWGLFSAYSWLEKARGAFFKSLELTLVGGGLLLIFAFLPAPIPVIAAGTLLLAASAALVIFVLPIGLTGSQPGYPTERIDERETIFARARLEPGSETYHSYYEHHPDHLSEDQRTRELPGLLSREAKFTQPLSRAAAEGSFFLTESLRDAVDGPVEEEKTILSSREASRWVKSLARFYGARTAGITVLKPEHIYTHIGRGSGTFGQPIELDHTYAVAFTVEMDYSMVSTAPFPALTMESGRQYVEAARIAVQLAGAVRQLGYRARAHIDGNYRVIAPLVAREAGLGEIGRMGLLMTPDLGPRVRLGVVSTDLPLLPDSQPGDPSMIDFCRVCRKCAENCPSRSIPFGDREEINGALRWKINADTCFRYWNAVGTDCGKCMAVCPFSHPDTLPHNLVRWGIRRSGAFRRLALGMDNFFYGRYPEPHKTPGWTVR